MRRAVFLDRDGTLIRERHYLSELALVELEDYVPQALFDLHSKGLLLLGITNQSGVAKGLFPIETVHAINQKIDFLLAQCQVFISGWFVCPHDQSDRCDCRKPAPRLVLEAAKMFDIDCAQSFVIGDKQSDLELASAVGATGILILTGHGRKYSTWAHAHGHFVAEEMVQAARTVGKMLGE